MLRCSDLFMVLCRRFVALLALLFLQPLLAILFKLRPRCDLAAIKAHMHRDGGHQGARVQSPPLMCANAFALCVA